MPSPRLVLCLLGSLSLPLFACGGGDDADGSGRAGSGGASAGTSTSSAGSGGTSAGSSGSGGTTSGGTSAGSSGSAGKPAGGAPNGGSGGSAAVSCDLEDAVVSCEVDSGGGVRVCTEVYEDGTPADVTRSNCGGTIREGEHCPDGPNLVGVCKGGISTYYYAPASNNVWMSVSQSCPALMGTWCGP